MKVSISMMYLFSLIGYLVYGDNTVTWGGINIISQLLFMIALCVFVIHPKKNTVLERTLLEFIVLMTGVRIIYTIVCMCVEHTIRVYNADIYTFVLCTSFVIFLIYCAMNHKSLNK